MASITNTGISIDSFNDLFNTLSAEYKNIYGEDLNIDQDTSDGQKLSIFVKAYRDLQELGVDLYNSFDPDTATGIQLNKLIKLCGITRGIATKSLVDIEVTTSQAVTLDSDYTLKDTIGQTWIISSSQTLSIGTTTVSFTADEWGAIEALPNTITEFESIVIGVDSVTNPLSAIAGVDEETDNELKIRRNRSVSKPSQSSKFGLLGKLLELNGVIDAKIHENKTDTLDTDLSLDAHSVWVIVDGGDIDDIHEVIANDRALGVNLKGSVTDTVTSDYTINNRTVTTTEDSAFDRPTETEIYVKLNVSKKDVGTSIDEQLIKDKILTAPFYIYDNIYTNELYPYIYQAGTTFVVSDLQISRDNITFTSNGIAAGYDEKFVLTDAKITITEI